MKFMEFCSNEKEIVLKIALYVISHPNLKYTSIGPNAIGHIICEMIRVHLNSVNISINKKGTVSKDEIGKLN